MARLRRPHASSGAPVSDSGSNAYPDPDPPGEIALPLAPGGDAGFDVPQGGAAARGTASAASAAAAAGPPTDGHDFEALLPDVQVSDQDRRRERRLVDAACRGEESAIEALYRTHYDTIYRYVLLRLGSLAAAEDVTSQVFLGMVRGLGRYRDEGRPFIAWLYGIAQKQIAFFQRGESRAPGAVDLDAVTELVAAGAGPHATAEQRELRGAVARALGKVPEGQREVIMLRYLLSLSVAETAAVVGRTEGAVKQLQLRGLATLKNLLGREGRELL
ncbi:MAG: sigma-70 family RNA polymerase sigma factor [Actinobacteria bacterium]|nr:sigma-70 family RNA polymerase sigma factor [Actinomycetota bacterium]